MLWPGQSVAPIGGEITRRRCPKDAAVCTIPSRSCIKPASRRPSHSVLYANHLGRWSFGQQFFDILVKSVWRPCFGQHLSHSCGQKVQRQSKVVCKLLLPILPIELSSEHQQVYSRGDGAQQKFLSEIKHPNLDQCDLIQVFACSTLLQFTYDFFPGS